MQKLISIITPCFNEEENAREVYQQVKDVFAKIPAYRYEHIFIDNASTDKTASILREIAKNDLNVKVIINSRNFGTMNSYYAMFQCSGDAVIQVVADLQDPPPMIKDLIKQHGYTQVQVAKYLGISTRGLIYKLKGDTIFTHKERVRLARLLHITLKEFNKEVSRVE